MSASAVTPPSDRSGPWDTFALTAAAVFLVSLDATVVVAAFPALRAAFDTASPALLSLTLNAYTIVVAALLVPAGRMADLWGRKRLFLAGVAVFTLASALCAAAPEPGWLIVARILQAAGAALLTPSSLALVLRAFPAERRAAAVGLWSAVGALAAAIGPAFGSWLIDHASWRWVFLINLPLGALAWWRARQRLAESTAAEQGARPDVPGILLLVCGVGLLTLAIVRAGSPGAQLALPLLAAGIGLALVTAFVAWARRRPDAALDLSLFDDRDFRWVSVATLVFGAAFTAMFLASFLFQMGIWGWSQSLAGLALTPGPLIVIPVAVLCSRLAGRTGQRPLLICGGVLYAAAQGLLAWRVGSDTAYLAVWLPSQVLTGIAIGLVLPALSAAAVAGLPPARFGIGSGVSNALRQMGGAIGAAVAIGLVGRASASLDAFRVLFGLLAASGLAVALLALPLARRGVAAQAGARP